MAFLIPVIFFWLALLFAAVLWWRFRKRGNSIAELIEDERAANDTRKRSLEEELFYSPDLSVLPFHDNAGDALLAVQDNVRACAGRKMIRFGKPMKNIELKRAYGVGNLEAIAQYEENYHRYCRSLISWSEGLIANGFDKDGMDVLEETVRLGSEYKKSFTLLADRYAAAGDTCKLDTLLKQLDSIYFMDNNSKNAINSYINKKKAEASQQ